LISEEGHVVTAWSYVLDTEFITTVLNDGRKFKAEVIGADPRSELAVLKIEGGDFPYFSLSEAVPAQIGDRVLAFSNLYGIAVGNEPASVLHGHVSAITRLAARRGAFQTAYDGSVYVLDAMTNNAGAAGGALTDFDGRLLGILGKELRNAQNNVWLNFAFPVAEVKSSVDDILAGKVRRRVDPAERKPADPVSLARLGIVLIPDVLPKTPPFVERVLSGSPAEGSGIRPDDLVLFVGPNMVQSRAEFIEELSFIDRLDPVRLTVLRDQQLLEFEMTSED
jgi:serine protease Do